MSCVTFANEALSIFYTVNFYGRYEQITEIDTKNASSFYVYTMRCSSCIRTV
jgi:hypothetical protein